MRVKQYFVHSSFCGVNKNIYHPSKYAAINDAEFKAMLAAVIKEHGEAENKDPQNVDHLASNLNHKEVYATRSRTPLI